MTTASAWGAASTAGDGFPVLDEIQVVAPAGEGVEAGVPGRGDAVGGGQDEPARPDPGAGADEFGRWVEELGVDVPASPQGRQQSPGRAPDDVRRLHRAAIAQPGAERWLAVGIVEAEDVGEVERVGAGEKAP
jgi:hypothetical protein